MDKKDKLLLAQKVMNEEIDINTLSDDEVEEMINFFEQYISETDQKMERIKQNIFKIRKKINWK